MIGLAVGVWLVALPAAHARRAREAARDEAAKKATPSQILDVWAGAGAGAELLAHNPGPAVTSEAEASGWVTRASEDLSRNPVAALSRGDRRSVLAVVYACREMPSAKIASPGDLRALLGPSCIGVAFVACEASERRAAGVARWVLVAVAVAVLAWAGFARITRETGAPTTPAVTTATAAVTMTVAVTATATVSATGTVSATATVSGTAAVTGSPFATPPGNDGPPSPDPK